MNRERPIRVVKIWCVLCLFLLAHDVYGQNVEDHRHLLILISPDEQSAVQDRDFVSTIESYLADMNIEITTVSHTLPAGDFSEVRHQAQLIAAERGAQLVIWGRRNEQGSIVLWILHIQGETALVRFRSISNPLKP